MAFLTELRRRIDGLASVTTLDVEASALPGVVAALDDERLLAVVRDAAGLANAVERLRVVAAGVVADRSTRDRGHAGLAATQGHRTPALLVQSIAGGTRADAERQVRLGVALVDGAAGGAGPGEAGVDAAGAGAAGDDREALPATWGSRLQRAMLAGDLTAAQHDAIRRGLGDPPARDAAAPDILSEAWALAADQLQHEASRFPVEELLRRARQVRDALDPVGTEERFAERYARRSFRAWIDAEGAHHAHILFDDEMAAWVRSITDAALRPRRGGPRFVDSADAAQAARLVDDPRTDDQLTYDLLTDLLRAGSLADAEQVFGARQPGIRVVVVKDDGAAGDAIGPRDALGRLVATAHVEDGGDAVPGSIADRTQCLAGRVPVVVDSGGNPLDVGREQRLFTPRQRVALAVRDGGCLHPGCRAVASACESHHIDHWDRDRGRTDVDRGVLLCRFHHMLLHNNGWSIRRERHGPFVLHPPPGARDRAPIALASRSAVRWAWDPPPDRSGWREAPPRREGRS